MEKKLYKVEEGKIICGVCKGIAEYANIDPTIIRLIFVAVALFGAGILLYILAAIIMPAKPTDSKPTVEAKAEEPKEEENK